MTSAVGETQSEAIPIRAIVLLAAAAFSSSINMRACDPLLPQIAADFSATVGQAASIITGFAVGYGLLQLVFGPVGDRFGKYRVAALTSIAAGFATAASARAGSLDGLVAARFVAGAFAAAVIPLAFAWIGDVVPFAGRQPVLARFLSAQISGIILGQAAGGFLGERLGWRAVFVAVGVCHVLAGVAMLVELRINPSAQPAAASSRMRAADLVASFVALLTRRWVRVMLAAVLVEAFAFYGAFAYVGADLHHRFGLGFGAAGAVMAAFGLGAIAYAWSARRLLGLLGERGLVICGGILMAGGYAVLSVLPVVEGAPFVMATLGLGFYMMHNTLQTNATQMAPDARGLGVSCFALALFLGQSLGVALAAPVVDRWGQQALYVSAAVVLPMLGVWFRSRLALRPA